MCLCFVCWGERAWTGAVVLAAVVVAVLAPAVVVAVLAPAVAADLLAVALIGFASFAFALSLRSSPLPSGSPTTAGYPLHTFVYGVGWHPVDLGAGLVLLAFGSWLVPRTIGAHSGLARRNSELLARVRRLTVTRCRIGLLMCPVRDGWRPRAVPRQPREHDQPHQPQTCSRICKLTGRIMASGRVRGSMVHKSLPIARILPAVSRGTARAALQGPPGHHGARESRRPAGYGDIMICNSPKYVPGGTPTTFAAAMGA
jgi:hypothetical protein